MKFLVDMCAGRRLAAWLRLAGHDVSETRDRSPTLDDQTILAWATAEERVVVTVDKDFGSLAIRLGQPHHGIVRLPDVPSAERITLMEQVLERHARELENRAIITVTRSQIRVRAG